MRTRDFVFTPAGALRSAWRIAIFVLVAATAFSVAAVVLFSLWNAFMAAAVARGAAEPFSGFGVLGTIFLSGVAGVLALLVAHLVSLRWVERRGWEMVGLHRSAARPGVLVRGFVIGVLALAMPAGVLMLVGWLGVREMPDGSWLLLAGITLIALAPAALFEELALRGYAFSVLREVWGWKPALLVLSVVFGVWHYANPGATVQALALVSLAGVFLGMVLVATRSLYAAWLAHLGWNWTLVALLHTELSGIPVPVTDYRVVDTGPDWVTGGSWGPEGGVAAGVGMLLGIGYLLTRRARREES